MKSSKKPSVCFVLITVSHLKQVVSEEVSYCAVSNSERYYKTNICPARL